MFDVALNYPPYCLHYRWQRRENLRQWAVYRPRALYAGVGAYAFIVPITCLTDGLTNLLRVHGAQPAIAAFGSGMLAAAVVSAPIGNAIVVDLRLSEAKQPAGTWNALRYIRQAYGARGFYTGLSPLLVREGAYSWSVFYAKGAVQKRLACGDLAASAVAGTVATVVSQPADTLATAMQNQVRRRPLRETVAEMYSEGGLYRFYRGFIFRWYAIIAGVYVMDSVSQTVKSWLGGS